MIAIILMAGRSGRFKAAGYQVNKAVLPTPSGTVFQDLADTFVGSVDLIVTIASKKDNVELMPHIAAGMPEGLRFDTVWLTGDRTNGAIDTVVKATPKIVRYCNMECIVSYCDVITRQLVAPFASHMRMMQAKSGFVLFNSTDPRYGYWDGHNIVEKKVVSPLAISGLFYFNQLNTLLERASKVNGKEVGIPSALTDPKFFIAKPEQIIDIGVPEDYERYVKGQR